MDAHDVDVLIVGGGVAGLWILDEARRAGHRALLVEAYALGSGQTVASQGILHGGFKHALGGRIGGFTDALRGMTAVWRACLDGQREPNLLAVNRRANACYFWRMGGLGSFATQKAARYAFDANVVSVQRDARPIPLASCPGEVYRLDEQVVDPQSLVEILAERNQEHLLAGTVVHVSFSPSHVVDGVQVRSTDGTRTVELRPCHLILTAGEGNAELRGACGLSSKTMRRLPLPILTVQGDLPDLHGVCLENTRAKVIVTTQRINATKAVWQVACEGDVPSDPRTFETYGWKQLREACPGYAWPKARIGSYVAHRAEPSTGERASDVFVKQEGNIITAWPIKLVLAPRLAEQVLKTIGPSASRSTQHPPLPDWPRPPTAAFPWDKP